jgi:hypothetical protein
MVAQASCAAYDITVASRGAFTSLCSDGALHNTTINAQHPMPPTVIFELT